MTRGAIAGGSNGQIPEDGSQECDEAGDKENGQDCKAQGTEGRQTPACLGQEQGSAGGSDGRGARGDRHAPADGPQYLRRAIGKHLQSLTDYENRITFDAIVKPERLEYHHGGGDDVEPVQFRTTVTFEDSAARPG